MGGYKREAKVYKLNFSDPDMDGLVVMARSISTGRLMKLMRLAVRFNEDNGGTKRDFTEDDLEAIEGLLSGFAKALDSWNLLDDDDRPVPATLEGLQDQEFDFSLAIVMAWLNAVGGVSKDLGKDSTSGPSFPEVSIPTELLSPSLTS